MCLPQRAEICFDLGRLCPFDRRGAINKLLHVDLSYEYDNV
jgi:hypothetical protein